VMNAGSLVEGLLMDNTGAVTMPLQPLVNAAISETSNVTGDGTAYTFVWDSERVDVNGDFNTGTGVFTAPVTGKYLITYMVGMGGLTSSHTSGYVAIVTGNKTYPTANNPWATKDSVQGIASNMSSVIADMDATDTAHIVNTVSGGAQVVDVSTFSHLSIGLVA